MFPLCFIFKKFSPKHCISLILCSTIEGVVQPALDRITEGLRPFAKPHNQLVMEKENLTFPPPILILFLLLHSYLPPISLKFSG